MEHADRLTLPSRRSFLGQAAGAALLARCTAAAPAAKLPPETLISVWEHAANVDIAPVIQQLGFNTVWTHDKPYDGKMKLEDTLMYRHMRTPGVKYVIAKVERGIWGWSFDQAMSHAEWIASLAKAEKQIIGLYMNDFYPEIHSTDRGGHSLDQFRQIIAKVRSINPQLAIFVPVYPTRESNEPFDFDYDALIFNIHFDPFDRKQLPTAEQHLVEAEKKFRGKPILTGLYWSSGRSAQQGDRPAPLSEKEFRFLMGFYVRHINEGKTKGLRIFRAQDFLTHPEYVVWAREELAKLKTGQNS
jgi:hypothetical protein